MHDAHASVSALPPPDEKERACSETLVNVIRREIEEAGGGVDFSRYMELALYAPGLGYYSAGNEKFGDRGDFITAPEMSSVFAHCLARPYRDIRNELGGADILEFGAGSGALAADLLRALDALDALPEHYFILELSAELRARQHARIDALLPRLRERVQWLDTLPDGGFRGVVFANEVLDAMPVRLFRLGAREVLQRQVAWDGKAFAWKDVPADPAISRRVGALGLPPDYISEINLHGEAWIRSVADVLEAGVLLLIDYGFPRAEYYHPQRTRGTLMCHYRHRAHDDPFILTGLQDITAHVDFTAAAEAAVESGLSVLGYTGQASFLIDCGLDRILTASRTGDVRADRALLRSVEKLTSPAEMGELYKVIALGRGVAAAPLTGFRLHDRRAML